MHIYIVALLCFIFTIFVACEKKEQVGMPDTAEQAKTGESLFKRYCSPCHADGGNNVNPQKTLHKKDREANGVNSASDIVSKMRNPGPGMTIFDEQTIPKKDAKAIAEYVLRTF
jgi:cytochrome c6